MRKLATLAFACIYLGASAQTVYKCGNSFQQTPCDAAGSGAITVKPASGKANAEAATAMQQKQQELAEKTVSDRLRREIWYKRRDAQDAVDRQINKCKTEQAQIEQEKLYSNNNLAGATRDVSISQKMEAAARLCTAEIEQRSKYLEEIKAKCKEVKCDSVVIAQ